MNTATYRGMARNAAQRLEWAAAAKLYDLAADKYPTKTGELAARDIATLRAEAAACRTMVQP